MWVPFGYHAAMLCWPPGPMQEHKGMAVVVQPFLSLKQGQRGRHCRKISQSLAALVKARREQKLEVWINIGEEMIKWCMMLYRAGEEEKARKEKLPIGGAGAGAGAGSQQTPPPLPLTDGTPPSQEQQPARQPQRQRSGGSDAERLAKRARTTEDAEEAGAGAGAGGTVEGAPGAPEDAAMAGAGDAVVVGEEARPEEEEDKDRQEEQEEDEEAKQAKKAAQLADDGTQI